MDLRTSRKLILLALLVKPVLADHDRSGDGKQADRDRERSCDSLGIFEAVPGLVVEPVVEGDADRSRELVGVTAPVFAALVCDDVEQDAGDFPDRFGAL